MILIAGSGALADAIERQLSDAGEIPRRMPASADLPGETAAPLLAEARALILTDDDDAGNVDLCLRLCPARPGLAVIARVFDTTLASYLARTLPGIRVLSMSRIAAPAFAEAAKAAKAAPSDTERPALAGGAARLRPPQRVDRVLVAALACLFAVVFPSALFFSHALDMRYIDALYFVWTTVMTVGYGDIALKDAGDGIKLFGMVLMLAGAAFIAVLFALLSDWVLGRRLEVLQGRVRVRRKGHTVIAGAGNIGYRIAETLAATGETAVLIEARAESPNIPLLRAAGHHVIIADATWRDTLSLAALEAAAVLIAVTDSDAVNLQIALHARETGIPVVMRVESPELSAHVSQRGDAIAISPIVAAASAFAEAARAARSDYPPAQA